MKAKFIFNLDNEDDRDEFETMNNARKYKQLLYELDDYLRDKIKYQELPESKIEVYQEIRDWLTDWCIEENINLN